jgi:hypothetical protein
MTDYRITIPASAIRAVLPFAGGKMHRYAMQYVQVRPGLAQATDGSAAIRVTWTAAEGDECERPVLLPVAELALAVKSRKVDSVEASGKLVCRGRCPTITMDYSPVEGEFPRVEAVFAQANKAKPSALPVALAPLYVTAAAKATEALQPSRRRDVPPFPAAHWTMYGPETAARFRVEGDDGVNADGLIMPVRLLA